MTLHREGKHNIIKRLYNKNIKHKKGRSIVENDLRF